MGALIQTADIDFEAADHWAVRLVVKEHVKMQLNLAEKILAVGGLRQQRIKDPEIADILRISETEVEALVQRWRRLKQGERMRLTQLVSA